MAAFVLVPGREDEPANAEAKMVAGPVLEIAESKP